MRQNQGAAGVDGVSIDGFEADLKNNLYRIWNRMSSGTWFPAGARSGDPETAWRRHQDARHRDRRGQGRSDRCCRRLEALVEPAFLWIPAWTVCPGRQEAWLVRTHLLHLPRLHVPGALGAAQERQQVLVVPARDQQGCPEEISAQSAPGGCTAAPPSPSPNSPRPSIRSWRDGCGTTGRSTAPRCIPSWRASTPTWCDGSARNTDDFKDPKIAYRKLLEIIKRYPSMFTQWQWVPWAAR